MSGIYIHIPFCKQACHYCNFHFSTSLKRRDVVVEAILEEMIWRKDYLGDAIIDTIYFGGGTPSLLTQEELQRFFDQINELFEVSADAEITLEANPDDLTLEKLQLLRDSPVNRLSIGIQSFFDEDLKYMNRAHDAGEAIACINNARKMGFEQLTIDLIYGAPTTSDEHWKENMQRVFDFGIPHISCYCLTVEPNTALDHFVRKGKSAPVDEIQAARQFEMLMTEMAIQGYEHYEISNFAKPGQYSKHNSNYWLGVPYLGLGPSAHSFDGTSRQWNIAHNGKYVDRLNSPDRQDLFEKEVLTKEQLYNEYVMTSLRTTWGCNLQKIIDLNPSFEKHFIQHIQPYLEETAVIVENQIYKLTNKGRLLADRIAMEVFL